MKAEKKSLVIRGIEPEPEIAHGPMPVIFFVILAALLFGSLLYLDEAAGGFNNRVYAPYGSLAAVNALQPKSGLDDKIARGKTVYDQMCMLCHQTSGLGTPGQYPPLDGSEWVTGRVSRLAGIPLHGLSGPITVKGEQWNASMPAMGASLNAADLAALLTYIRQAWSNKAGEVMEEQTKKVIEATAGRTDAWKVETLMQVPETE